MSSPLAIGAVSAVLRNLLDNGLIEAGNAMASSVHVTAVAPDTIDLDDPEEPPRLNLFLHHVTRNSGWSNTALPSRTFNGERRTNAPLALDLHYMLTAYGRSNFEAEILLGYGMHLLHERPVLDREAIRRALRPPSPLDIGMLPPAFQALVASDLADQLETIKITPAMMGTDEMSKLWSAIQTHYRPSTAYNVSVVLIESTRPASSPLPVLTRGRIEPGTQRDRGVVVNPDLLPAIPTLFAAEPPDQQSGARLGEAVPVSGIRLRGAGHMLRLAHRLLAEPLELAPSAVDPQGTGLTIALPDNAGAQSALAAGQWAVSVAFTPQGDPDPRETNSVPLMIAPSPVIAPDAALALPGIGIVRSGAPSRVTVTLFCRPQVRLEQRAVLILGTTESGARPRTAATDPLVFDFPDSLAPGPYWLRLRVDGADSILLDRTDVQPQFDPSQEVTVPP